MDVTAHPLSLTFRRRTSPRRFTALLLGAALLTLAGTAPLCGQRLERSDPSSVAAVFLGSLQRLRWETLSTTVDGETVAVFREHIRSMAEHDPSGRTARRALGGAEAAEAAGWTDERFFARLVESLHADVPMLLGVLATNTYDPLGEVREGEDLAHVLVRTTPYTNGSTASSVEVVTLRRAADGWRVIEAPALDAFLVALGTFAMG